MESEAGALVQEHQELVGHGRRPAFELRATREARWREGLTVLRSRLGRAAGEVAHDPESAPWNEALVVAMMTGTMATNRWLGEVCLGRVTNHESSPRLGRSPTSAGTPFGSGGESRRVSTCPRAPWLGANQWAGTGQATQRQIGDRLPLRDRSCDQPARAGRSRRHHAWLSRAAGAETLRGLRQDGQKALRAALPITRIGKGRARTPLRAGHRPRPSAAARPVRTFGLRGADPARQPRHP